MKERIERSITRIVPRFKITSEEEIKSYLIYGDKITDHEESSEQTTKECLRSYIDYLSYQMELAHKLLTELKEEGGKNEEVHTSL